MGNGAPLSEDIPNKEICDATMCHKSETAIGKNGKNQNKFVKIGINQEEITRAGGIFL